MSGFTHNTWNEEKDVKALNSSFKAIEMKLVYGRLKRDYSIIGKKIIHTSH